MSEKKSIPKKRNWAAVVYPESAPENWREILQRTGLQCAISPLHDADVNADETQKKAHWHIIMCYSGPTAYEPVKRVTDSLNAPSPQPVEQVKGYYRYLTHKDNPDKVQYDEAHIEHINGFDVRDFSELTKSEIFSIKREIQAFVRKYDIEEYADLLDLLSDNDLPDMLDVAMSHTIFCDSYVRSRRHKAEIQRRNQ
jgi:hypothetical protein